MADLTGLYRDRTIHGAYVRHLVLRNVDGDLKVRNLGAPEGTPPRTLPKAELDHRIKRGFWERIEAPPSPRVVFAGSGGFGRPAVVLGEVVGPDDRLPGVIVRQTSMGLVADVHWTIRGEHRNCKTFHAEDLDRLHAQIRSELEASGWLFLEVGHA